MHIAAHQYTWAKKIYISIYFGWKLRRTALFYMSHVQNVDSVLILVRLFSFPQMNTAKRLYACLLSTDVPFTFSLQYKRTNVCPIWDLFEQNETKPSIFTYYLSKKASSTDIHGHAPFWRENERIMFCGARIFPSSKNIDGSTVREQRNSFQYVEWGREREADEKAKKESHPCCMQYEWSWWTCFSFFFLLCFDLLAVHLFHERWMTDWQANNDDSVNAHIKTSLFTFYGIANEL